MVFRDLKPENIVLTRRGYLKLIDLGLAKLVRGYSKTFCGTPHYIGRNSPTVLTFIIRVCVAAPEVILNQPYTFSPDYWTLGVIVHELVTGDAPYDRTFRERSNTEEFDAATIGSRSTSTIESGSSDIIRASSKHYNMYVARNDASIEGELQLRSMQAETNQKTVFPARALINLTMRQQRRHAHDCRLEY